MAEYVAVPAKNLIPIADNVTFEQAATIEYSANVIWGLENYGVDAEGNLDKDEVIKMSREKVRKIKCSC